LIPSPFGIEIVGSLASPMTIMFESLVEKMLPRVSLTWAISNEPGCFSRDWRVPILPILFPPVIVHKAPFWNFTTASIAPVAKLNLIESLI